MAKSGLFANIDESSGTPRKSIDYILNLGTWKIAQNDINGLESYRIWSEALGILCQMLNQSQYEFFSEFQGTSGKKKGQKSGRNKKANKKSNNRKNSKKINMPYGANELANKLFETMEKHKEVCLLD